MQRVGEVIRTAQGSLIVRSDDEGFPGLGAMVIDQHLDQIGRVVDVIGPVSRPYIVIRPIAEVVPGDVLHQRVYTRE